MALRDMSTEASQVWAATSITEKRDLLDAMILSFSAKGKNRRNVSNFKASVRDSTTTEELDRIAAQLALFPVYRVVK